MDEKDFQISETLSSAAAQKPVPLTHVSSIGKPPLASPVRKETFRPPPLSSRMIVDVEGVGSGDVGVGTRDWRDEAIGLDVDREMKKLGISIGNPIFSELYHMTAHQLEKRTMELEEEAFRLNGEEKKELERCKRLGVLSK
eukprot:TRINITY_DN3294_c1_g1_i1.p1 TRINITY_DN3294_c1_g1~~TRINITY_DN3294_c1_g1_i1.p1  ORF type:complete len:141 (-),score=46.74 TRINITY_DN3294_c1_g1_i1:20-442(-)